MHVLLVQSNREDGHRLSTYFSNHGHAVVSVQSRDEAMQCVGGDIAIIIDLDGVPDDLGIPFVEDLRRKGSTLPIVMLGKGAAWSDKVQAFDAGVDDYIAKPYVDEEVLVRVQGIARRCGLG